MPINPLDDLLHGSRALPIQKMREAEHALFMAQIKDVQAESLDEIASDSGFLTSVGFGDSSLDDEGIHSSASLMDIKQWLPIGLENDDITIIGAVVYCSSRNSIFVGGTFRKIGGVLANNIAEYNLTYKSWQKVGDGVNGYVGALALTDGDLPLYVGGNFTDAGGVANADYITSWNGSAFSAVGSGLNNVVRAITVDGTDVYIGGDFTNAGGNADADKITVWNGSSYSALGTGIPSNSVYTILVDGGDIWAGGNFANAGGNADADNIAIFRSGAWQDIPEAIGFSGVIYKIKKSPRGEIFVVGSFDNQFGCGATGIAYLQDGVWSTIKGVVSPDYVHDIVFEDNENGKFFIFGHFEIDSNYTFDDEVVIMTAYWNGEVFRKMGSGLDGGTFVSSCAYLHTDGALYVGGSFNEAGSVIVRCIAVFSKRLSTALETIASLFELYSVAKFQSENIVTDRVVNIDTTGAETNVFDQPVEANWLVNSENFIRIFFHLRAQMTTARTATFRLYLDGTVILSWTKGGASNIVELFNTEIVLIGTSSTAQIAIATENFMNVTGAASALSLHNATGAKDNTVENNLKLTIQFSGALTSAVAYGVQVEKVNGIV